MIQPSLPLRSTKEVWSNANIIAQYICRGNFWTFKFLPFSPINTIGGKIFFAGRIFAVAGGIIPYSDGVVVIAAKEGTGMRAQMWSKVPVVCNIFMPDSVLAGGTTALC